MLTVHGRRPAAPRLVSGRWNLGIFLAILLSATIAVPGRTARAQVNSQSFPSDFYYLVFRSYYDGEFRDAAKGFRDAARSGLVSVDGPWIDAICYHTMIGECLYQTGDMGGALDQYDAALKIYLAYSDWMLRVEFPPTITDSASAARSRITWGPSKRASKLGTFPEKMLTMFGRLDNATVVQQGGVVAPPEYRTVGVPEIVRCTGLALRRRREIMGPACPHDPLTGQLVAALSRRPAPPNHWSQAWVEGLLGLALASSGESTQAIASLQKSILVAGQYDHVLTGAMLLELGKLAFEQDKFDVAGAYFHEATLAAATFDQFDDVEEAFHYATISHLVTKQQGIYPPLVNAALWARTNGSRGLQASLPLLAGECATAQGDFVTAGTFLDQATRVILRSDLVASTIGARQQYLAAQINFQRGNLSTGAANLTTAMTFQRKGSRRLYQIALADKLYVTGAVSPRVADLLFASVLRDPVARDWLVEPRETLGVILNPHPLPLEHWFELTLIQRKDQDKALEISDMVRRHRFYSTLPFGGRLLALRWLTEAPKTALSETAQRQRQDLLLKYPAYAELSQKARAVRAQLERLPLVPDDAADTKEQIKLLVELGKLSLAQEAMLSDLALRREPSEFSFPPVLDVKSIQQAMPAGQLTLAYFSTTNALYAFLLSKDKYSFTALSAPAQIRKELVDFLRDIGHFDRNQGLTADQFTDDKWKSGAARLLELLVDKAKPELWDGFDELVIVPDGMIWYVPFEALQVPAGENSVALSSKIRIRYAPTISTTLPDGRGHRATNRNAVVSSKLFQRDSADVGEAAFDDVRAVLPGAARLGDKLPAPSGLFSSVFDRLVVLDQIDDNVAGYAWSPVQIDRNKPGSDLGSWLALPWGGSEQIALPGFQTAAADGLRRGGTGDEIFLSVCGLMASGSRTILIGRWRTGGQTSVDLMREFLRELPRESASKAWARSVQLAMAGTIDPDLEPRVKAARLDHDLKSDHPFFWASYLLVDTAGDPNPAKPEVAEAKAAVK